MPLSLYNRLYSYRQRENKNERENFLIEIFGFCLDSDETFFKSFLGLLGINYESGQVYNINTQASYEGFGRPDLEIFIGDDTHILIECKVESSQGHKQLERYRSILVASKKKKKNLVYLTKYKEFIKEEDVKELRWVDILKIIPNESSLVVSQLKKYLNEEGMNVKNFDLNDVIALQHIHPALKKVDEVLNNVEEEFKSTFGGVSQRSTRSTRLVDYDWYGIFKYLKNKDTGVQLGIGKYEDEIIPCVFIEFYFAKKDEVVADRFRKLGETLKFDYYDDEWYGYYQTSKSLTDFMKYEEDSIKAITEYFEKILTNVKDIKKNYREIID